MNASEGLKDYMKCISMFFCDLERPLKVGKTEINTLLHILSGVTDFRMPGKIVYRIENLLAVCFILALKGEFHSFSYAATYIRVWEDEFVSLGLVEKGKLPSHDTFRRVLGHLDANGLRDAFVKRIGPFLEKMASLDEGMRNKYRLLSGDGKTFSGSGRKDGTANLNVFNIFNASTSVCLSSVPLTDKDSEIPEFQRMLPKYDLRKTIVTADALHCQRETCRIVTSHKGHYAFKVKGNMKSLHEEIISSFEDGKAPVSGFSHNECDYEFLKVKDIISDVGWPSAKTYVRMVSHKRKDQKNYNPEYQYFVSSLSENMLIAEAIDNRWQIEDDLHYFKDTFLAEDCCTFMDGNAVKVMAILNNIVFSFYRIATAMMGYSSMMETKIRFKDRPLELIALVVPMLKAKNVSDLIKANMKGRKNPV